MARKTAQNPFLLPYNVGGRCLNRDWFEVPLEQVWEIMSDQLHFISHAFDVKIHLFVLMANHFHLMVSTPQANLPAAMRWFMRETSRMITKHVPRINQTYGGRHFRCVLSSTHYFLNAYKYNYRNPVRARICTRVEDYRYSSLSRLLGRGHLGFPVVEDVTLFEDVEGTLKWLNKKPHKEYEEAVRKALRRSEFKLTKVQQCPHPLEAELL